VNDALAWTVEQVFRTANLPGEPPAELRRGHAAQTLAAAIDNIWRNRVELCRRTGLSQSTVGRTLVQMHARGEVEMTPARGSRPARFRRAK
jgi:hypothetical protein